jgi:NAD(P)-dependent dehydrogenase (short-subunit alcohol dehydrogenase family)
VEPGSLDPATDPEVGPEAGPDVPPAAVRYEVELALLPPAADGVSIAGSRFVILADEGSALAAAVAARLTALGAHAAVLPQPPGDDLPTALLDALASADGLIHLGSGHADTPHDARLLFPALRHAALGGTSRLMAVTGSGGHFALSVNGEARDPAARRRAATGARGLMKTLAAEFPDAHVRAVDIDPGTATETPEHVADLVVGELLDAGGPVEVGWHGTARVSSELVARAALPGTHRPPLPLGPDSVVLVTGGARGITAKVALALAAESSCSLVLVGRSPLPGPEDPRTTRASGRADLRRTLLELGELRTPAEIEAECSRLLGAREIRATLEELSALGAQVDYHALDVRDSQALGELIDGVYERHGRLDGVVHGAGVLDDRFIRDKTTEGFERVFATKVDAAHTILDHVRDDAGFVVFFGSVSGVFGNRGQVDYAAANDALDGLARIANVQRAGRVVSVDWGPWQGAGMVSDDLEREYRRRGIGLIEVADGVRALLDELRAGPDGAAQAVVMRAHHGSPFASPATTAAP